MKYKFIPKEQINKILLKKSKDKDIIALIKEGQVIDKALKIIKQFNVEY